MLISIVVKTNQDSYMFNIFILIYINTTYLSLNTSKTRAGKFPALFNISAISLEFYESIQNDFLNQLRVNISYVKII